MKHICSIYPEKLSSQWGKNEFLTSKAKQPVAHTMLVNSIKTMVAHISHCEKLINKNENKTN